MKAPKNPVPPCNSCGHDLESEDQTRDTDFCIFCLPDVPEDEHVGYTDDEDYLPDVEDSDEAAYDRVLKEMERADD